MDDLISRQAAIEELDRGAWGVEWDKALAKAMLESLPTVQPTLYGYNVEYLELIASVLQKENLPPARVAEALNDIGRVVEIVRAEFEATLRKAVEQCEI